MREELVEFMHQFIIERGHNLSEKDMMQCSFKRDVALDSFEILTLVMNIEVKFGVRLEPSELLDPTTDTFGGFITMVLAKLA